MPVTSQGRETSTVFDDVFRTMLERLGRFMIPVLNEVFGMEYKMDSKLIQLKNEHVTDKMKNVTYSHLQVGSISIDSDQYHLECQSQWDGDISIRMIEYDFSIALENATKKDGIPRIMYFELHKP